jgi:hypothetical protein
MILTSSATDERRQSAENRKPDAEAWLERAPLLLTTGVCVRPSSKAFFRLRMYATGSSLGNTVGDGEEEEPVAGAAVAAEVEAGNEADDELVGCSEEEASVSSTSAPLGRATAASVTTVAI